MRAGENDFESYLRQRISDDFQHRLWTERPRAMTEPSDDEELERLLADLEEWCRRSYNEKADEILARIDEVEAQEIADGQVILLGLEGQVDGVWSVPEPLPFVLRRPIQERLTALPYDGDPTVPSMRTATYRRVGQFTYQREPE